MHLNTVSKMPTWMGWMILTLMTIGCVSGDKFSSQGKALYKSLLDEVIGQGICPGPQACSDVLQLYSEDGDRVYMNMYGQADKTLGAIVAKFLLENGTRLTDGVPITLRIYPAQKSKYAGLGSIFGAAGESVVLEINK